MQMIHQPANEPSPLPTKPQTLSKVQISNSKGPMNAHEPVHKLGIIPASPTGYPEQMQNKLDQPKGNAQMGGEGSSQVYTWGDPPCFLIERSWSARRHNTQKGRVQQPSSRSPTEVPKMQMALSRAGAKPRQKWRLLGCTREQLTPDTKEMADPNPKTVPCSEGAVR